MLPGRAGTICAVHAWRFVRLFARIFGPAEKLDVAEIEAMGLLAVKIAQMYLDGMALACAADKVLLDDVAKFAGDFGESG